MRGAHFRKKDYVRDMIEFWMGSRSKDCAALIAGAVSSPSLIIVKLCVVCILIFQSSSTSKLLFASIFLLCNIDLAQFHFLYVTRF